MGSNNPPGESPPASQSGAECCDARESADADQSLPAAAVEAEWPKRKRELDALLASLDG